MLESRGIKKGTEVFVKDSLDSKASARRAWVVRTYPHPSQWLVVRYEDGNMEQVQENQVTTMFEENRRKLLL